VGILRSHHALKARVPGGQGFRRADRTEAQQGTRQHVAGDQARTCGLLDVDSQDSFRYNNFPPLRTSQTTSRRREPFAELDHGHFFREAGQTLCTSTAEETWTPANVAGEPRAHSWATVYTLAIESSRIDWTRRRDTLQLNNDKTELTRRT